MKCQLCSNPATVHLTKIVEQKKKELHLCERCAEQQQLVQQKELSLPAILQTLIGQHVGPWTDELARLACPACGIKYMEFRAEGRLGCPHDYAVFRVGLEPLLQRIHRAGRHVGKAPRRRPRSAAAEAEVLELKRQLRAAVEAERYEEAARLRDLLREKEAADEPG
ncbi:MAG TPA: UvrB/UvrC motif-containing protein [Gemmataceae bacterium]|nr:UvrB/UvrC motif-containing protein [Gemmataceae bacterium]